MLFSRSFQEKIGWGTHCVHLYNTGYGLDSFIKLDDSLFPGFGPFLENRQKHCLMSGSPAMRAASAPRSSSLTHSFSSLVCLRWVALPIGNRATGTALILHALVFTSSLTHFPCTRRSWLSALHHQVTDRLPKYSYTSFNFNAAHHGTPVTSCGIKACYLHHCLVTFQLSTSSRIRYMHSGICLRIL